MSAAAAAAVVVATPTLSAWFASTSIGAWIASSSIYLWFGSLWTVLAPLIPGAFTVVATTSILHFGSFVTSWWIASRYASNCIGSGLSGMYNSYWTMGSSTCTSLLFSHVSLLGVAIASGVCTIALLVWYAYSRVKLIIQPTINKIKEEFKLKGYTAKDKHEETITRLQREIAIIQQERLLMQAQTGSTPTSGQPSTRSAYTPAHGFRQ